MEARKDELEIKSNDDIVEYTKLISPVTEGALSRLHYRMQHVGTSHINSLKLGDYAGRYFPGVYEALENRGLVMPLELPERQAKPFVKTVSKFMKYPTLTLKISKALIAGRNSFDGSDVWLDPPELKTILSKICLKDILPHSSLFQATFNSTSIGEKQIEPKGILTSLESVTLPAFANDHSEMFLASMIERQADSWDLHLTTFLLCEKVLVFNKNTGTAEDMYRDRDAIIDWAKASLALKSAKYQRNGARAPFPRHFCKITTKAGDEVYTVEGTLHNDKIFITTLYHDV